MEIYIGIPCYQVAASIRGVLERLSKVRADMHVIVLNDGSRDALKEVLNETDTSVFKSFTYREHEVNKGYGGAQKTIFGIFQERASSRDDLLVLVHGDGQTSEDEIVRFIDAAQEYPHLDAILGSRMLNSIRTQMQGGRPLYKILADYVLTFIQNNAYGLSLSTYASGYRAFRKKGIDKINFSGTSDAHTFDTEALILFRWFGIKHREICVKVIPNDTGLSANHLKSYAIGTIRLLIKHAFQWRKSPAPRYAIINADDYGYATSVNEAVAAAFKEGVISSASIMATGEQFAHAVSSAKTGGYTNALGVHVNLTEGKALGSSYKTITNPSGEFLGVGSLIIKSIAGRIDPEEVLTEVRLQINACRNAGLPISHLDTHQWSQVVPEIDFALRRAAASFGIPCIRSIRENTRFIYLLGASPRSILNSLVIRFLRLRLRVSAVAVQSPEQYYGILLTGHTFFRRMIVSTLKHLLPGTSEIMCHIGSKEAADLKNTYYKEGRYAEMLALSSSEFRLALKENSVQLISFAEYAEL